MTSSQQRGLLILLAAFVISVFIRLV